MIPTWKLRMMTNGLRQVWENRRSCCASWRPLGCFNSVSIRFQHLVLISQRVSLSSFSWHRIAFAGAGSCRTRRLWKPNVNIKYKSQQQTSGNHKIWINLNSFLPQSFRVFVPAGASEKAAVFGGRCPLERCSNGAFRDIWSGSPARKARPAPAMSHLDLSYWVVLLLVRLSNCWNKMDYIAKICQNDIIHFQRIFHCKPSSYWGTSLYGNLHIKPLKATSQALFRWMLKRWCTAPGPHHREELLEHWKEVLERLSIPHSKACEGTRLWRCLEESKDGLGMTSNCCRECNDYIWLYMFILYNIAHRSGRLPGSLYFFRVKWPEFSTDLHEVVEGFLTQMSDSPGS